MGHVHRSDAHDHGGVRACVNARLQCVRGRVGGRAILCDYRQCMGLYCHRHGHHHRDEDGDLELAVVGQVQAEELNPGEEGKVGDCQDATGHRHQSSNPIYNKVVLLRM